MDSSCHGGAPDPGVAFRPCSQTPINPAGILEMLRDDVVYGRELP